MNGPSPAQFERLYDEASASVFARCKRFLRSDEDAWDATQESFARAYRYWDSWDGTASRKTWLLRIATNHCLNVIRDASSRRRKLDARQHETPGAGEGPRGPASVEVQELLRTVLAGMDEELARPALLYWFEDMTQQEIAVEIGLSVPTVRKRLRAFVDAARDRVKKGFESQIVRAISAGSSLILMVCWRLS